jgi:hypothetical protein
MSSTLDFVVVSMLNFLILVLMLAFWMILTCNSSLDARFHILTYFRISFSLDVQKCFNGLKYCNIQLQQKLVNYLDTYLCKDRTKS